ncbi:SCO family protein [Methyloversatilis sp.]|uniref:SCO family protein n=1 Tax=Methyloversatilis sp. TaxID=2569862 RepID=UPI0035B00385
MKGKKVLVILAAVCVLPLVASYAMYFLWRPDSTVNYGQLLSPRAVPAEALSTVEGKPFAFAATKGRWTLVLADDGKCDARCEQLLYFIRQVRKAQGEHQERIERVWLVSSETRPRAELLNAIEGTHVVRAAGTATLAAFATGSAHQRAIHLVDPLGQVIMRYPDDPDPKKMIKDLQRLMKYSRLG